MLRALLTVTLLTGLVGCREDSGPTTPGTDNSVAFTGSARAEMDDAEFSGGTPQADNLEASIVYTHLHGRFKECEGEDGHYFVTDHTFTGTSIGDSRLTGRFEVHVHDLFNSTEGLGPQTGHVVIRDALTGRKKAEGTYSAWGPTDYVQGTLVGRVYDEGAGGEPTRGAGNLAANWRVTFHADGSIVAQIGGAVSDNRIPAGVSSGTCDTKFTPFFDLDVSPPGMATANTIRQAPSRIFKP